ncbi:MAG: 50S ribosomal protein L15 [Dehalococcoidia bacterium]
MSIDASELQPAPGSVRPRKRVGRGNGSGHGTYSGRGMKGQKARRGKRLPYDQFEGGQFPTARRFHVMRGFNNKWRVPYQPINLADLDRFADGAVVTPESLLAAGVLRHLREPIAILAGGELNKKLVISAHKFSKTATTRIEELGGTITTLEFEKTRKIR